MFGDVACAPADEEHVSNNPIMWCGVTVQTVPKTLSPQWREQFDLHLYEESGGVLEITVWDRDTGRRDDFIGRSVGLDCSPVLLFLSMLFEKPYMKGDSKVSSSMHGLNVCVVSAV